MKLQIAKFTFHLNAQHLLLIGILLSGAFLRIYKISDYMTFLGDEGRDALVVYGILHGKFTLLGPTASVGGFFLGPIYYYFMTPFLWFFGYDPVGPAIMVALFGVATVWLVYKIGSEFFNKTTGIIASFLYAISPIVTMHARSSWNPNLMPFFSLLTLYVVYRAVKEEKTKLFVFSGILLGIAMQLHYLAVFLGTIVAFYVLIGRLIFQNEKIKGTIAQVVKNYFLILCGFIIGWLPFLAFEIRHGFLNFRSILQFIFHSGDTGSSGNIPSIIWDVFVRLTGRLLVQFPDTGSITPEYFNKHIVIYPMSWEVSFVYLYIFALFLLFASLSLFLMQLWHSLKSGNKQALFIHTLLLLWLGIGVGLFGFYKKPIYDYYFEFMFPLPFLLIGNVFSNIFHKGSIWRIIAGFLLMLLVYLNLQGMVFRYPPNRQKEQAKTIAKFVMSKAEGKPFNFALVAAGNSDHAYRYFFAINGENPITIQNPQLDPKRQSVTEQLMVICEDISCEPLGHSLWEIAGFGRAEIADQWDVSVVKVYRLVPYKGP